MSNGERVIRILGHIGGGPTDFDGEYIVEYDPSRDGMEWSTGKPMRCLLVTTPHVEWAARFPSPRHAFERYRAVDPRQPLRPDGRPNRPLTAFTVEVKPPDSPGSPLAPRDYGTRVGWDDDTLPPNSPS